MTERRRCAWAGTDDELYRAYHDEDWGVPVHEDRTLFELLVLEGAQAGLSWRTILGKREGYRRLFEGFDPALVAAFDEERIQALRADPSIVRNEAKIRSAVRNARAFLEVQEAEGSFDAWIWSFVDGAPQQNAFARMEDMPAETETSRAMSKALKARGFNFVGPTICYAFMQAVGMVNDHTTDCFRWRELGGG